MHTYLNGLKNILIHIYDKGKCLTCVYGFFKVKEGLRVTIKP